MEGLLEKLKLEKARLLRELLAGAHDENDRSVVEMRVLKLLDTLEELELVAAAASPSEEHAEMTTTSSPNPTVLNAEFYTSYLLVLLLANSLNDARFLWKRIAASVKQDSEPLRNAWEIGKALWQRNFAAAYAAMSQTWPQEVQPLVDLLKQLTRESTAELLSSAYSTISISDAANALGFAQQEELVSYCAALQWEVSPENQLIHPKPLSHALRHNMGLEQLESLSHEVSEKTTSAVPDLDKAIQLVNAKQNAYYIQAVKDTMQAEQLRKYKLTKVVTHVESSRLEKKFAKERKRDRERLRQMQEDHMMLLNAKIAEWKAHGVKLPSGDSTAFITNSTGEQVEPGATAASLQPPQLKKSPARKVSKETLSRLATPRDRREND
ncbi:Cop9 signalosome complex subunit, partial [Globisporangium splendens]